jgi:hypothetical protein
MVDRHDRNAPRQSRRLRWDIDLEDVGARARDRLCKHARDIGQRVRVRGRPVERRIAPVERPEGQRLGFRLRRRARSEPEEGCLDPVRAKATRKVHRVAPDAAGGVDRHEKACHARNL